MFPLVTGRGYFKCCFVWGLLGDSSREESPAEFCKIILEVETHEVQGASRELAQSEEEEMNHIAVSNCLINL